MGESAAETESWATRQWRRNRRDDDGSGCAHGGGRRRCRVETRFQPRRCWQWQVVKMLYSTRSGDQDGPSSLHALTGHGKARGGTRDSVLLSESGRAKGWEEKCRRWRVGRWQTMGRRAGGMGWISVPRRTMAVNGRRKGSVLLCRQLFCRNGLLRVWCVAGVLISRCVGVSVCWCLGVW